MECLTQLARLSVQNMLPYRSARCENEALGIQLDANENPFWRDDLLNRYPYPQPEQLRKTLATLYGVKPAQLLMTRGSDEGIDLLVRVFCEANQDAVVLTPPTYGMYEVAANIQGAKIINVPLTVENGFALNPKAILQQWDPRMKLIFLCSPNNPTGNVLAAEEVLNLCEQLKNQALIVVDEAYVEFASTTSLSAYVEKYPNMVVLRTLSKAWGLAGVRLGSLIANEAIIALLKKVMAPYPLPFPIESIVMKALSIEGQALMKAQVQRIRSERESLRVFLEKRPSVVQVFPSEANFLLVKVRDALQWMDVCKQNHIIVRSRHQMLGLRHCLRISIGTREEMAYLKKVIQHV